VEGGGCGEEGVVEVWRCHQRERRELSGELMIFNETGMTYPSRHNLQIFMQNQYISGGSF
jgi:hypothetical protein